MTASITTARATFNVSERCENHALAFYIVIYIVY